MFRKTILTIAYIGSKIAIIGLKRYPRHAKRTVGGINYYGPELTLDTFEEAITVELPKYDVELSNRILKGDIKLDFFYEAKAYCYTPTLGAFTTPKWIFDYGSEGVCQFIVYSIIGANNTGVGLNAAIRLSKRKTLVADCMQAMKNWIKEKKFPEQWLSSYNYEENLAAMTNGTPKI
jgi:hypothetical protein